MRWFRFIYNLLGAEDFGLRLRSVLLGVLHAIPSLLVWVFGVAVCWSATALYLMHARHIGFVDAADMIVSQRPVIDSLLAAILGFALLMLLALFLFCCVAALALCAFVLFVIWVGVVLLGGYVYTGGAWRDTKKKAHCAWSWVVRSWEKSK